MAQRVIEFGIITLLPEMFHALTKYGVVGRAFRSGKARLSFFNPRDFTTGNYCKVDDKPYGGGPGMVMMPKPLLEAINAARRQLPTAKVVALSPHGHVITQRMLTGCNALRPLIFVCGRYEGIDQRVLDDVVDEQWSIGDYVLSGGELPAMVLMDALLRLIPGVLGELTSAEQDSFSTGLLEGPQYTRPKKVMAQSVPAVLLSGHHQAVKQWRLSQSLGYTFTHRPDLFDKLALTDKQKQALANYFKSSDI